MILPGRDVPFRDFLRRLWRESQDNDLIDYAGSIAFSAVLAIFPFLLFAVALASVVVDPSALDPLAEKMRRVLLPEVADLMAERLRKLTSESRTGLLTFGAVGAVWVASGAISALTTAVNTAYDVRESRPFWKTRGLAVLLTLAAAVLFLVATAITFVTPSFAGALGSPLGPLVLWLRWPIAIVILMLILASLYYLLPDVEQKFRFITLGSVVAVLVWVIASLGFSLFVVRFGGYEIVYGALGSVIMLLMWVWISALAVLLGAQINAVLEHLSPEGKRRGERSASRGHRDIPGQRAHPRAQRGVAPEVEAPSPAIP